MTRLRIKTTLLFLAGLLVILGQRGSQVLSEQNNPVRYQFLYPQLQGYIQGKFPRISYQQAFLDAIEWVKNKTADKYVDFQYSSTQAFTSINSQGTYTTDAKRDEFLIKSSWLGKKVYRLVGGFHKYGIYTILVNMKEDGGLFCNPFPSPEGLDYPFYTNILTPGIEKVNFIDKFLKKYSTIKNLVFVHDGSPLSTISDSWVVKFIEVSSKVMRDAIFIDLKSRPNPKKILDTIRETGERINKNSRFTVMALSPAHFSSTVSNIFSHNKYQPLNEHTIIGTNAPDITVAFRELKTIENVRNAFKSVFFIVNSMEEKDLPISFELHDDLVQHLRGPSEMYNVVFAATVRCIVGLYNSFRIDKEPSKMQWHRYEISKITNQVYNAIQTSINHKHPLIMYKISGVEECAKNQSRIGHNFYEGDNLKSYCFRYQPQLRYENEFNDITEYDGDVVFANGEKIPPRDLPLFSRMEKPGIYILYIFVLISVTLNISLLIYIWKNRNLDHVKIIEPKNSTLILIGTLLWSIYASLSLIDPSSTLCKLGYILEISGYLFILTPLSLKNWRLHLIFHYPHISEMTVNKLLVSSIVIITTILIPNIIFISLSDKNLIYVVAGTILNYLVPVCPARNNIGKGWIFAINAIIISFLILFNIYISIVCKGIVNKYNESRSIALCCYTFSAVLVATFIMGTSSGINNSMIYSGIFTFTSIVTLLVIFNKGITAQFLRRFVIQDSEGEFDIDRNMINIYKGAFNIESSFDNNENRSQFNSSIIHTFLCVAKYKNRIVPFNNKDIERICHLVWIEKFKLLVVSILPKDIQNGINLNIKLSKRFVVHSDECSFEVKKLQNRNLFLLILDAPNLSMQVKLLSQDDYHKIYFLVKGNPMAH